MRPTNPATAGPATWSSASSALVYAVWLVYAGGWQYLLIAAVFYLVGTALYVWARRESRLPAFTKPEWAVVAVVALTSVVAIALMATGNLSVL